MGPGIITSDIWAGISRLMIALWFLVPLVVVFGGSLLLSLAIIPSLVASGELPPKVERLRPPLYAVAFVTGVAFLAALVVAVGASGIIGELWPRWWI